MKYLVTHLFQGQFIDNDVRHSEEHGSEHSGPRWRHKVGHWVTWQGRGQSEASQPYTAPRHHHVVSWTISRI